MESILPTESFMFCLGFFYGVYINQKFFRERGESLLHLETWRRGLKHTEAIFSFCTFKIHPKNSKPNFISGFRFHTEPKRTLKPLFLLLLFLKTQCLKPFEGEGDQEIQTDSST